MQDSEPDRLVLQVQVKGSWLNAWIDCGAKRNFIDPETVTKLGIQWKKKQVPYPIVNAEGQLFDYNDGIIDQEVDHLKVKILGKNQGVDFDIVPLGGKADILLGMPWLRRTNPNIDWPTGQVLTLRNSDNNVTTTTTNDERSQTLTNGKGMGRHGAKNPAPPRRRKRKYMTGRERRQVLGILTKQDPRKEDDTTTTEDRLHNVPEEYRSYDKLFQEELDTGIPEHNRWDHEIILTNDNIPLRKIYPLNERESKELGNYIQEGLRKGHIRPSASPAGAPMMFVPKKNGKLRPVIDYRDLNARTVKDRTPLPLITELKDRLQGKQIFTALDLKGAYNLVRIKEGDEWKTAFRTKFGLFEYLVMPFGLTNAPATFQKMINHVLRQYLDIFVVCYLDDILIFSDNEEEHKEHVHKVLKALQDAKLLVEPEKCHFHVTEVDFLGHTITPGKIRMDRKKISAVKDWPLPTSVKEVQSFLGFANYYRRFIKNFSGIAKPLTELTKKDRKFVWLGDAQKAFEKLRNAILEEPVLIMFDPDKEIELETDASDYALGGQIGQRDDSGKLHPIAFYSHKLHGAELNYPIYDKEFLAIFNCFKEFRHYLMGSKHQIKVYTDHKNIVHFTTTQELNRRQTRYAEYLCEFDFVIIHRKGSDNGRADAISRRPDFDTGTVKAKEQLLEKTPNGEYKLTQQAQTLGLTLDGLYYPDITEAAELRELLEERHQKGHPDRAKMMRNQPRMLGGARYADTEEIINDIIERCKQCSPNSIWEQGEKYSRQIELGKILQGYHDNPLHEIPDIPTATKRLRNEGYEPSYEQIKNSIQQCKVCSTKPDILGLITKTKGKTTGWNERWKEKIQLDTIGCNIQEPIGREATMRLHNDKIWVPEESRHELVRELHEHPLHGHPGITKTLKKVQEHFDWEKCRQTVEQVIKQCDLCAKTKSRRHKPYGELQPLPVAQRPWDSITMDFITKLPLSEEPSTGIFYDSVLVVVDRLTKFCYYIPYQEATEAEQMAYIFYDRIFRDHGLPSEILSDRGTTFASKFWQALSAMLGTNHRLSTAFRPQTDGQTERMNQVLEQYLRCYINYEQNNWVEKLPIAQFAYNTAHNESTKLTPAYANFGFTPDAYHDKRDPKTINPAAILKADDLKNLHEEMKKELEHVRQRMKRYYNVKKVEGPTFKEGDMVYLSTKNITTKRPSHKLDYKYIGPYKVKRQVKKDVYDLDLPPKVRLHPVYHISFLESAAGTIQVKTDNEPQEVDGPEAYEAEEIRDMQKINGQTMYLVKWKNYPENENTWEPPKHLINAQRLLKNFHQHRGKRNQAQNSNQ
jgi:transposase InsO family protein